MADGQSRVGWILHGHGPDLSVIVDVINVANVAAVKPKDDSPVCRNSYGPQTSESSSQRMKPVPWQVHITRLRRYIQSGEYPFNLSDVFWWETATVPMFIQTGQASMSNAQDHAMYVTYHLSGDNIKHNHWGIITNELLHRHSKMKSPCLETANAFGAAVPD